VLPGVHKVTLKASGPFASADQIATVQPGSNNPVSLRSVTLTAAAQTAATKTVKDLFTSCLQRTDAYSNACPQRLNFNTNAPVKWQVVGDPTDGLKFNTDPSGGVNASGYYLMTATVTTDDGIAHRISGGPYAVVLTWDGQAFQVQGFGYSPGGQTPLVNPGAGQTNVLDAVKAGWQTCLAATTFSPPDCPARAGAYNATAPKWSSATDPMAGAIVSWDGSEGVYKVTGNYSLVVKYTNYSGQPEEQSLNGRYTAVVVWASQKAALINIE
jgi:hypothetical protein